MSFAKVFVPSLIVFAFTLYCTFCFSLFVLILDNEKELYGISQLLGIYFQS